jgi:hypothetical protein
MHQTDPQDPVTAAERKLSGQCPSCGCDLPKHKDLYCPVFRKEIDIKFNQMCLDLAETK